MKKAVSISLLMVILATAAFCMGEKVREAAKEEVTAAAVSANPEVVKTVEKITDTVSTINTAVTAVENTAATVNSAINTTVTAISNAGASGNTPVEAPAATGVVTPNM